MVNIYIKYYKNGFGKHRHCKYGNHGNYVGIMKYKNKKYGIISGGWGWGFKRIITDIMLNTLYMLCRGMKEEYKIINKIQNRV